MIQQLESVHPLLAPALGIVLLLAVAVVVDLVAKRVLVRAARRFAENSRVTWDDALVAHNVFGRLSQVLPPLVVFLAISFVLGLHEALVRLARKVVTGYMVLMLTMTLTSLL